MEVNVLAPDEFDVECQVRKIVGDPINRLAKLQIAITNEEKNPVLKPFKAHAAACSAPQREIQKCALKISEHRNRLLEMKPEAKPSDSELRKIEVRLIHVEGRLQRLFSSTKSYKQQCQEHISVVGLVLAGVQTLMQGEENLDDTLTKIKEAQPEEPEDLSTSEDEEPSKRNKPPRKRQSSNPAPNTSKTMIENENDREDVEEVSRILSSTKISQEPSPPPEETEPRIEDPARPEKTTQYHITNIISKWKISFDGDSQKLPIERFLFRVEHLAKASGIMQDMLVDQVGSLLAGVASNWYWCHIERNPKLDWSKLTRDLLGTV